MKNIFTIILFIGALAACNRPNIFGPTFELTAEETLSQILSGEDVVSPEQVLEWIDQRSGSYQLIDLRPQSEFVVSHLGGAVNIPTQYLLEEEYEPLFQNTSRTTILYGKDQLQANGPWLLLRQMGYQNLKVMQGGFDFISMPLDTLAVQRSYVAEQAHHDYAAVFNLSVEESEEAIKVKTKPKPQRIAPKPAAKQPATQRDGKVDAPKKDLPKKIVPQKKVVVEEEEGC